LEIEKTDDLKKISRNNFIGSLSRIQNTNLTRSSSVPETFLVRAPPAGLARENGFLGQSGPLADKPGSAGKFLKNGRLAKLQRKLKLINLEFTKNKHSPVMIMIEFFERVYEKRQGRKCSAEYEWKND